MSVQIIAAFLTPAAARQLGNYVSNDLPMRPDETSERPNVSVTRHS
jgi:hypothetical protein